MWFRLISICHYRSACLKTVYMPPTRIQAGSVDQREGNGTDHSLSQLVEVHRGPSVLPFAIRPLQLGMVWPDLLPCRIALGQRRIVVQLAL